MKNPEDAIERVLAGLREAEIPLGMEARILLALEARSATKEPRRWWNEWVLGRDYGWRLVGGTLASGVCLLAIFAMTRLNEGHVASRTPLVRITAPQPRSFAEEKEAVPQRLKPHDISRGYGTAEAVPLSETDEASSEVEGHVDYDSLAVSEMLAPSRPAPPLPLTHQEELMMGILRHGARQEQLAMLDPAVRARDAEQSTAEFHTFFDPPAPNPNE